MNYIKELVPQYASTKSFYGKATLVLEDDKETESLYSYNTKIASIKNNKVTFLTDNKRHYTNTTLRHLNEFMLQNGLPKLNKNQYLELSEEVRKEDKE